MNGKRVDLGQILGGQVGIVEDEIGVFDDPDQFEESVGKKRKG